MSNVMLTGRNGAYNHLNKFYMAFLMFLIMLMLMAIDLKMFIILLIVVVILIKVIRKQYFINDNEFIKGMIEHHDMALLMAGKIKEKTKNKKIYTLANSIIINQQKEIEIMKTLLN